MAHGTRIFAEVADSSRVADFFGWSRIGETRIRAEEHELRIDADVSADGRQLRMHAELQRSGTPP